MSSMQDLQDTLYPSATADRPPPRLPACPPPRLPAARPWGCEPRFGRPDTPNDRDGHQRLLDQRATIELTGRCRPPPVPPRCPPPASRRLEQGAPSRRQRPLINPLPRRAQP